MNRYRCKVKRTFKNGESRIIEYVVKANNFHRAYNKLPKSKISENIVSEDIIYFALDETSMPEKEKVISLIKEINDASERMVQSGAVGAKYKMVNARQELYKLFRNYQPMWDDDALSDILSFAEEGELDKCGDLDKVVDMLLEELDGEWE